MEFQPRNGGGVATLCVRNVVRVDVNSDEARNSDLSSLVESISTCATEECNTLGRIPALCLWQVRSSGRDKYLHENLNASAHLLAGRTDDALVAVQRIGTNVTRGWLGTVDRAAEEGLVTNQIDFGLALCVRGVPPGPFQVMPLTGIRTVRDFLADWTVAHVLLYGAVFGVLQVPVSLQNLLVLEAVEEIATLAIAGELSEVPAEARTPDLTLAQQQYLARGCYGLSERRACHLIGIARLTCSPEMFPIFGRVCFSRGRTNETQQVQR
jgi:hypothetical protein